MDDAAVVELALARGIDVHKSIDENLKHRPMREILVFYEIAKKEGLPLLFQACERRLGMKK